VVEVPATAPILGAVRADKAVATWVYIAEKLMHTLHMYLQGRHQYAHKVFLALFNTNMFRFTSEEDIAWWQYYRACAPYFSLVDLAAVIVQIQSHIAAGQSAFAKARRESFFNWIKESFKESGTPKVHRFVKNTPPWSPHVLLPGGWVGGGGMDNIS